MYVKQSGTNLLFAIACAGNVGQASAICGTTPSVASSSFSVNQVLDVQTDTPYTVLLYATQDFYADSTFPCSAYTINGTSYPCGLNYSASASVDPTITLDTTNPAYSLEFSPGLVPSATPEPSCLILLATGLAGAFALTRRSVRLA